MKDPCRMTSPWFCDSGRITNPQHSGHWSPWSSAPGPPQLCDTRGGQRNARTAEGGFERRSATLTVRATREKFALGTLVRVTGEHYCAELEAQVPNEEQQRDAHGPPLDTLVVDVDVGDCEIGARLGGSSAELASNNRALDGP